MELFVVLALVRAYALLEVLGHAPRVLHVIGLSGGKDSTAMAVRLHELNPDVPYELICTPTGDELPEMQAHWLLWNVALASRSIG